MRANYEYPLDLDWSTADKIKVTTLYELVEDAYERGVDRNNLLAAYNAFKTVVPDKGTEGQLGRAFEDVSGYSLYAVMQAARTGASAKVRMRVG